MPQHLYVLVGFRYSIWKTPCHIFFSFFLDYHFMFLFPRYNNQIINTTRFVESSPPRWLDFFPLAYSLYPKNATQPKGKNYSYHVGEYLELDLCTWIPEEFF